MKTFVSLIGVLVVATAAVWMLNRPGGNGSAPAPTLLEPGPTGSPSVDEPRGQRGPAVVPPNSSASDESPTAEAPATPAAPPAPVGHNAYHNAAATLSTTRPITPPGSLKDKPSGSADAPPTSAEHEASPSPTAPGTAAKPDEKTPASPAEAGSDASGPKFTLGPETEVKKEDDGWTRLDGRFLVRGEGTAKDPLIVPWELLVSASESYRPRTGLKEMPRRVADLKGKHVRVTGYVLFPLMSLETTEVLLMRNQWDGCCIGVPPTPYDAVEVKLAKPADRKDSFISFVTIEGVLDVDPYVNRDFLLGLFTMSDAKLSQPAKGKDDEKGL